MDPVCDETKVVTNFKEIYKLQAGMMASSLEQLKKFTTVVADTGDFECKRER